MTKQERSEVDTRLYGIYCGILCTAPPLAEGSESWVDYRFGCPEYATLCARYPLEEIAGTGGEFKRGLRLCRWIAANVGHESGFSLRMSGEEMPFHSLALLSYAYGRKDRGLDCGSKAKILEECCLALGIYARRVKLFPNSPYDLDDHIVTEVYDGRMRRWCMLDPTSGGYFSDGIQPLSCLEMRETLAVREGSAVLPHQATAHFSRLTERNMDWNYYYAKNSYTLAVPLEARFGGPAPREAYLVPDGFDLRARNVRNAEYLLDRALEWHWDQTLLQKLSVQIDRQRKKVLYFGSSELWDAPGKYGFRNNRQKIVE